MGEGRGGGGEGGCQSVSVSVCVYLVNRGGGQFSVVRLGPWKFYFTVQSLTCCATVKGLHLLKFL